MDEKTREFGPYTIDGFLGQTEGGLSYHAHHTGTAEPVVLTIPPLPEEWEEADRFRRRFVAQAAVGKPLHHQGILAVHEVGIDEGSGAPFIAYEVVEGKNLRERATAGERLSDTEAALVGAAVAEALEYAHEAGVVHGNLRPSNIIVGPAGVTKVAGFGIEPGQLSPTDLRGQFAAGPCYLAPEQLRGAPADRRSDLFSLGIVLFELITGEHPFAATVAREVRERILQDDTPLPSKVRPDTPGGFNAVIFKLLQKEPERRPSRAAEVAESLRALHTRLAQSPLVTAQVTESQRAARGATPPAAIPVHPSTPLRRFLPLLAGGICVLLVLVAVALLLMRPARPPAAGGTADDATALRRVTTALNEADSALAAGDFIRAERLLTGVFREGALNPRALELSERLRAAKAEKVRRLFDEGVGLMHQGRWQQAETRFLEVLELVPGDPRTQEYLEATRQQGKPAPTTVTSVVATVPALRPAQLRPTPVPAIPPRLQLLFDSPLSRGKLQVTIDGAPAAEAAFDFTASGQEAATGRIGGVVQRVFDMPIGFHHVLVRLYSEEGLVLGEQVFMMSLEAGKEALVKVGMKDGRSLPRFELSQKR